MKRARCRHQLPMPSHGSWPQFRHCFNDDGQDLIEYALLAGVLSVGCLLSLRNLFGAVIPFFNTIIAALA